MVRSEHFAHEEFIKHELDWATINGTISIQKNQEAFAGLSAGLEFILKILKKDVSGTVGALLGAEIAPVLLIDCAIARSIVGPVGSINSGTHPVFPTEQEPTPATQMGGVNTLINYPTGNTTSGKKSHATGLIYTGIFMSVVRKARPNAVFRTEKLEGR